MGRCPSASARSAVLRLRGTEQGTCDRNVLRVSDEDIPSPLRALREHQQKAPETRRLGQRDWPRPFGQMSAGGAGPGRDLKSTGAEAPRPPPLNQLLEASVITCRAAKCGKTGDDHDTNIY